MTTSADGPLGYGRFHTVFGGNRVEGATEAELERLRKGPGDAHGTHDLIPEEESSTTFHMPKQPKSQESGSGHDEKGPPHSASSTSSSEALRKAKFTVLALGNNPGELRNFARHAAQPELRQALLQRAIEIESGQSMGDTGGGHVVVDLPSASDPAARTRSAHTLRHVARHTADASCRRALLECADRLVQGAGSTGSSQAGEHSAPAGILDSKSPAPEERAAGWDEALKQAVQAGKQSGDEPGLLRRQAEQAQTSVLRRVLWSRAIAAEAIRETVKPTSPEQLHGLVNEAMKGLTVPPASALEVPQPLESFMSDTKGSVPALPDDKALGYLSPRKVARSQERVARAVAQEPEAMQRLIQRKIDVEDSRHRFDSAVKTLGPASDTRHADRSSVALEKFRFHLQTPVGRAAFQARSVGYDPDELWRYAHLRRDLLRKTLPTLDPESFEAEVGRDLIHHAYAARADAVALIERHGGDIGERERRELIDRNSLVLMDPAAVRSQANALFSEMGTSPPHEAVQRDKGPLGQAIELRAELLRQMDLAGMFGDGSDMDFARPLARMTAERLEAQGITTAAALAQAVEERRVSLVPTVEDFGRLARMQGPQPDLTGILATMEEAFVSSGGLRSDFHDHPVVQAMSLRGTIIDLLRASQDPAAPPWTMDKAEAIARKCGGSPTDDPPGLGIGSGADLRRVINGLVKSEHIRSGLVELTREVRNGLLPALALALAESGADYIPLDRTMPGTLVLGLAFNGLNSLSGFGGSFNANSELPPPQRKDDKRAHIVHSVVAGNLNALTQLAPARARPALYVCQMFSTFFTGMGRSVALRKGVVQVPKFLNEVPATQDEIEVVRRVRARPAFGSTLRHWWGQMRRQTGPTVAPLFRMPGGLAFAVAQEQSRTQSRAIGHGVATGLETVFRAVEGNLRAGEDDRFREQPPP